MFSPCPVLQLQHNCVIHSYSLRALILQQHILFKEVFAIYFSQKHLSLSSGLTSTIPRVGFKLRLHNKHVCTHFLHGGECKLEFSKKDKNGFLWELLLYLFCHQSLSSLFLSHTKRGPFEDWGDIYSLPVLRHLS